MARGTKSVTLFAHCENRVRQKTYGHARIARMAAGFLTCTTCKNVGQNLVPLAIVYILVHPFLNHYYVVLHVIISVIECKPFPKMSFIKYFMYSPKNPTYTQIDMDFGGGTWDILGGTYDIGAGWSRLFYRTFSLGYNTQPWHKLAGEWGLHWPLTRVCKAWW